MNKITILIEYYFCAAPVQTNVIYLALDKPTNMRKV